MDKYSLHNPYSGPILEISDREFAEIRDAVENLKNLLALTENYEMVVESFKDFKQAKFSEELKISMHSREDYHWVYDCRLILNTKLYGYLSVAKYFNDSAYRILKKLLSEDDATKFQKKQAEFYDTRWGYRFSEELRNYTLHYKPPVYTVSHQSKWQGHPASEASFLVKSMALSIPKQVLMKDKAFKKRALEGAEDSVDILNAVEIHMESIWELHAHLTRELHDIAAISRRKIEETLQCFPCEAGEVTSYLRATRESGESIIEEFPILLKWDDLRLSRIKKLGNLKNLTKSYFSGK
jgi:hypothetical protein